MAPPRKYASARAAAMLGPAALLDYNNLERKRQRKQILKVQNKQKNLFLIEPQKVI